MSIALHGPAFVTGGSSGLGYALAAELLGSGVTTVLFSRSRDRLEASRARLAQTAGSAGALRGEVFVETMDVASPQSVADAFARARERVGAPRTLIHSAGVADCDYFEQLDLERFRTLLETNLTGSWNVLQQAVAMMRSQVERPCHILAVCSQAGLMPVFGYTAYGATKYGLQGLVLALRQELHREGIYLSLLAPPDLDTPQLAAENRTKPPETRALSSRKPLDPAAVARYALPRLARGKALILPSLQSRLEFTAYRFAPGLSERLILHMIQGAERAEKEHTR
ncbi:MAG: SDR family NAD(P)-dependent oxidoreductase [Alkalispirochaetaceae bacterium]